MNGFADLHQHLIFGMDDGPSSFAGTKAMIAASCADGIAHIFVTPHTHPGQDRFDIAEYRDKLAQMADYCAENELPVTLYPGAEILYSDAALRFLQKGLVPTLGGGRHALVEFFPDAAYETLFQAARTLSNAGYVPVFAHIERYACLVKDTARVRELKSFLPVRMQVNCSTVIQGRRFGIRRFVAQLLKEGLVDYVATDAHGTQARPTCMRSCYGVLVEKYGEAYAERLTGGNQIEAVGERIPRIYADIP